MRDKTKHRITGALAGAVNGLFGGGGGMVLLPLLTKWGGVAQKTAFATSVAVMAPVSAVSATIHLLHTRPEPALLLPCLLGGVTGGIIAGLTFEKVPTGVLRLIFAAFLLYGGGRYLL